VGEHDCCKPDSDSSAPQHDSKPCPHSQFTPQAYEKAEHAGPLAPALIALDGTAAEDSRSTLPVAPEAVDLDPTSHPPPHLFILNSAFRI